MSNILLETGNGEFEIVEFLVNGTHYGINVLKIKEIVRPNEVSSLPGSTKGIVGRAVVRDNMVSTIDLKKIINGVNIDTQNGAMGLLCEFNQTTVVFLIEEVVGIKRVKWSEITNSSGIDQDSLIIGTVLLNEKIIMLLDFESILLSLDPNNKGYHETFKDDGKKHVRSKVDLVIADDSKTVRELLKDALEDAGYNSLKVFNDGLEAYEYLMSIKAEFGKNFKQQVNLLISDIEMPMLDGYTLTRRIKEDEVLGSLPIILFSSLITDELYKKGEQVGADAQISKPSIKTLVGTIDNLLGIN